MSENNSTIFSNLTEDESCIYLFWCAILADGIVHPNEIKEAKYRANLHLSSLGLKADSKNFMRLTRLINDFPHDFNKLDHPITEENIYILGSNIITSELQMSILNSIVSICFSDSNFHTEERKVINILNDIWDS